MAVVAAMSMSTYTMVTMTVLMCSIPRWPTATAHNTRVYFRQTFPSQSIHC